MAKGLKDVSGPIASEIARITPEQERGKLDQRMHFVPLNINALEVSLGEIVRAEKYDDAGNPITGAVALEEFKNKILAFIKQKITTYKNKCVLTNDSVLVDSNDGNGLQPLGTSNLSDFLPLVVEENSEVVGLLFKSYDTTYDSLFRNFINSELTKLIITEKYTDVYDPNYPELQSVAKKFEKRKGFDIGHLLSQETYIVNGKEVVLATSPQAERIKLILAKVGEYLEGTTISPATRTALEDFDQKVRGLQQNLYARSTYGPKIEVILSKNVKNLLVQANALVVIIQERVENQYKFGSLLEGASGRKILELLLSMGFSTSVEEDIEELLYKNILEGKASISRSGKKSFSFNLPGRKKPNIGMATKKPLNVPASKTKDASRTEPKATNLITLQNLLDANLVQTVKQNMGTGSRRDILNLRSGRFAESVRVERLSESRQGMITAFYSYMRNPYGTFSAGGRQSQPASRDPKLLISRSIREVAQQLQITRLRAVQV